MSTQRNLFLSRYSTKKSNVNFALLTLLFFVVPFLHLGVTFYLSAQMLGFAGLLLMVLRMGVQKRASQFVALGCILFITKLVSESLALDAHELLLVMRELFCFVLLVLAVQQVAFLSRPSVLLRQYNLFLFVSLTLICIQFLAILDGYFIQFPFDWFVMNEGTLIGIDKALEYETRVRPVGFYGEPSYMAFVMVSALVVFLSLEISLRLLIRVLIMNLVAFVLLGSLSGVLAFFIVVAVYFYQRQSLNESRKKLPKLMLLGLVGIVAVVIFLFLSDFSGRISSLLSKDDMDPSIYIRYVIPVLMLSTMMIDGQLLGYSGSEIASMVENYGYGGSVDNAFFYLLLHYGVLGPLLIAVLIYYLRNPLLIGYMLVVLNFNGAYFSFDKVVVMSLAIGLSLGLLRENRMQNYVEQR